ncbi:MAG: ester cyclase [Steroidobacteraceae bacterium]
MRRNHRGLLLLVALLVCAVSACETSASRKQLVRGYIDDLLVAQRWERWDRYMAQQPGYNGSALGRETFRAVAKFLHTTFSDVKIDVDDQKTDGAWVTTRVTITGVQTGNFLNVPPRNRAVHFRAILLDRIEDGHVAEMWHQLDYWDALLQVARP